MRVVRVWRDPLFLFFCMLFLVFSVFLVAGLDLALKFDSFVFFLVTDNVVVFV